MSPIDPDLSALQGRLFEAVLFDLDGTLIDSTDSVRRSWLAWAPASRTLGPSCWGPAGAATLAVGTTTAAHQLDADAVVATLADVRLRVEGNGVRVLPG